MAVIYAGSEGELAPYTNVMDVTGDDNNRRGSVPVAGSNQYFIPVTTTSTDLWFHCRVLRVFSVSGGSAQDVFGIRASDSLTNVAAVTVVGGNLQFAYSTAADTRVILPEVIAINNNTFYTFDIRIQSTGGDTIYSFYFNEQLRAQVTAPGYIPPTVTNVILRAFTTGVQARFQDIIVSEVTPTVGMELVSMTPNADGFYTQFTNGFANVADFGYDGSDSIFTSTIGQRESWTFEIQPYVLGSKSIYGVVMNNVTQRDAGNTINDFQPFLRIGGTDYAGANAGSSNIAPLNDTALWTTNPATNQPWEQGDITTLESGILTV